MKTPKIKFRYSNIYNKNYSKYKWVQERLKKEGKKYPSYEKIMKYIKEIEPIWRKIEKKVLTELSKISGLKWKEEKIICYVVGYATPFSDPLTMPIYQRNQDYFIDTLIHELIHQLFTQQGNSNKSSKSWKYIFKKYKKESYNTKIHIPLHAIHSCIYLKFFTEKRMQKGIDYISFLPDYKRSWEIVQKEGYKEIINEFNKRLK